uniref:Uncharacterized protein n=1 Tax=Salarias fasciatus TaxID=181472 RepID=A0A672HHX7_SALFA
RSDFCDVAPLVCVCVATEMLRVCPGTSSSKRPLPRSVIPCLVSCRQRSRRMIPYKSLECFIGKTILAKFCVRMFSGLLFLAIFPSHLCMFLSP